MIKPLVSVKRPITTDGQQRNYREKPGMAASSWLSRNAAAVVDKAPDCALNGGQKLWKEVIQVRCPEKDYQKNDNG